MAKVTNDDLLKKLGLTDAELRDLQAKHHQFVSGLTASQKKSVAQSLPTAEEAAKTLGPGVTPSHLERFIRACRAQSGHPYTCRRRLRRLLIWGFPGP